MLITNKAIVLSKVRYNDNHLIVKCYTQQRGITSYLVHNAFKNKRNKTIAYFQPLSQLHLEEKYKQNQSLQYINEVKTSYTYRTIHTNILKSSIALFLAEILNSTLNEEEQNTSLFDYLETALQWLDAENNFSNFHLLFLLNLTRYLGFYPENTSISSSIFNLETGAFEHQILNKYSISKENNIILKELLGMKFDVLNTLQINAKQRRDFLSMLLVYFELHLGYFKKPKSLEVFNQVFN